MKKYRAVLAALIALFFYTLTDIIIWQRIFEANNMVEYAHAYHIGWFISLAGYAVIGVLLMWGAWKDCFYFLSALFVGAFSGLEDILYYLLDGKPIPESLPWLANHPMIYESSRLGLIGSVLFWLSTLVILHIVLYRSQGNQLQPQILVTHESELPEPAPLSVISDELPPDFKITSSLT